MQNHVGKSHQDFLFSIAFVCIGLETRFKEIFSKENRQPLKAFLTAQGVNIIVTLIVAYVIFGVIQPLFRIKRRGAIILAFCTEFGIGKISRASVKRRGFFIPGREVSKEQLPCSSSSAPFGQPDEPCCEGILQCFGIMLQKWLHGTKDPRL